MKLSSGARLGPYEILETVGTGGMGEVYKARDTRLQRIVAIKVSAEQFSDRFEREARMIASLNHTHICTVHDVGSNYLVMEFVEGETLQDRIARGPLPLADALPIARQIVEALEAAHQAGIIHRDLKPGNVKLTLEGDVKVLDFGLAKLSESALAATNPPASPTITLNATRAGMVIGTPAYMSPEQARGGTLDKRADIWAFGCVLFEMLTACQTFRGESVTDTIAAVLRSDPDWDSLPPTTPEPVRRLLKRCLEKDYKRRLTDIGVARLEIDDALLAPEAPPSGLKPSRRARVSLIGGVTLALIAAVAAGAWWGGSRTPQPNSWSATLMGSGLYAASARVSPDGKLIAFLSFVDGLPQLGVMTVDGGSWNIRTSDRAHGTITTAAWARDGSRIYFDRSWGQPGGVYSITPLGDEPPRLVVDGAFGPDTLPDGTLTVVKTTDEGDLQLFHFWPESGKRDPLPVFMPARDIAAQYSVAPDGKRVAFIGMAGQAGRSKSPQLWILDFPSGQARAIGSSLNISYVLFRGLDWARDGSSVFVVATNGSLQKVETVPANGGPARDVLESPNGATIEDIEVAKDGSLFLGQDVKYNSWLRFPENAAGIPRLLPVPSALIGDPQSSGDILLGAPDGVRSRLLIAGPGRPARPAVETAEETSLPSVLFDGRIAFSIGSGDSRRLAIASAANGRVLQRFAGPAPAPPLVGSLAASPDGLTLYYDSGGVIWAQAVSGGEPRRVTAGASVTVDPGGKYLYVKRNRNNIVELFRLSLTGGDERLIPLPPDCRHAIVPLMAGAADASGRLLATVTHPDTFYYQVGVIDTAKGSLQTIPVAFDGDVWAPTWLAGGGIAAMSQSYRQTIWRYAPKVR
jgi:serine/threonine protein kinase